MDQHHHDSYLLPAPADVDPRLPICREVACCPTALIGVCDRHRSRPTVRSAIDISVVSKDSTVTVSMGTALILARSVMWNVTGSGVNPWTTTRWPCSEREWKENGDRKAETSSLDLDSGICWGTGSSNHPRMESLRRLRGRNLASSRDSYRFVPDRGSGRDRNRASRRLVHSGTRR